MGWFKKPIIPEFQEKEIKNITDKMDKAIKYLENKTEYRRNAIRARCVRYLESRLDEITDYMIANMKTPMRVHSQEFDIVDIFGIEDDGVGPIINILKGKEENLFGKFLCDNKLTMALDDKHKKVKFAYGRHSSFESGWFEWAGYDLY